MKHSYLIGLIIGLALSMVPAMGTLSAQETAEPPARETGVPAAQESETLPTPGTPETSSFVPGPTGGPTDPVEVETFLDGVMAAHLESSHIAGAVVAIVKDGKLFFAKGYGYADLEKKKLASPDNTLFRTGSTGKLFTWTAVMQLVEKGQLDLDKDVNTYLKTFKIPATFPQPITMRHLLTHTPGFEDRFTALAAREADEIEPLSEYLAKHLPARVRPPGQFTAYSNHGAALAGYIVEVISGMPFEKYVEENIFQPLGMHSSTFRQPLPSNLADQMSVGYEFKDGVYEAKPFELFRSLAPAGSMSSTAADMAIFMLAHLNLGEYQGNRILQEETVKKMHTRLYANDPKTTGNAYGFWEYRYNNLRIIDHGGDTVYFHTLLSLVPEKNIGFYVAYNTLPGRNPRAPLLKIFLDRYYPVTGAAETAAAAETQPLKKEKPDLGRFTGCYQMARAPFTTYEAISNLFPSLEVRVTKQGNLLALSKQWVMVEPLVFKEVGGQDTLIFKEDPKGKITRAFLSNLPHSAFYKITGIANPLYHYAILICCMLLFLSVWRWPISALFDKVCRGNLEKGPEPRAPRLLAWIMANLYILMVIGLLVLLSKIEGLFFGDSLLFLKILLVLPLISIVLTAFVLVYTIVAWIKGYWTPCQRFHYTLVFLASLGFIWFLHYWNLLGFKI